MKLSINVIPVMVAVVLLTACGNTENDKNNRKQNALNPADTSNVTVIKPTAAGVDPTLATHIQRIYKGYLHIQLALAEDRATVAADEAKQLVLLLDHFSGNVAGDAQSGVYSRHSISLRQNVSTIANSNDLEQQRVAFEPLSGNVFELLKFYGSDAPVYQAHCPMAFNDKGASWLSDKAVVQNPYYGDDMLECGEIVMIIRK